MKDFFTVERLFAEIGQRVYANGVSETQSRAGALGAGEFEEERKRKRRWQTLREPLQTCAEFKKR
jgi:hypothetical protein